VSDESKYVHIGNLGGGHHTTIVHNPFVPSPKVEDRPAVREMVSFLADNVETHKWTTEQFSQVHVAHADLCERVSALEARPLPMIPEDHGDHERHVTPPPPPPAPIVIDHSDAVDQAFKEVKGAIADLRKDYETALISVEKTAYGRIADVRPFVNDLADKQRAYVDAAVGRLDGWNKEQDAAIRHTMESCQAYNREMTTWVLDQKSHWPTVVMIALAISQVALGYFVFSK
jgi:hypothetical protein